jgi:hypothetical protein
MKAYGNTNSQIVLLQPVDEHDLDMIEQEIKEIEKYVQTSFQLIAYPIKKMESRVIPLGGTSCLWKRRIRCRCK